MLFYKKTYFFWNLFRNSILLFIYVCLRSENSDGIVNLRLKIDSLQLKMKADEEIFDEKSSKLYQEIQTIKSINKSVLFLNSMEQIPD